MPKTDLSFNPAEYALVADRITQFYARFPSGRIVTELVSRVERGNGSLEITFRALVYRAAEDVQPAATGYASEREGDGDVNAVACVENTETSAIGRALANLGFTAGMRRPSYEEMQKAARTRTSLRASRVVPDDAGADAADAGSRSRALTVHEPADLSAHARDEYVSAVMDLLDLLAEAERAGLRSARATALRAKLITEIVPEATLDRIERGLRVWLAAQAVRRGTSDVRPV